MSFFDKIHHWMRSNDIKPNLHELITTMMAALPEAGVMGQITYDDTIEYFVKHKPHGHRVAGGAILRRPLPSGIQLIQIFLDEENHPISKPDGAPYGRRLLARELDQDLLDAFGNTNLILVK